MTDDVKFRSPTGHPIASHKTDNAHKMPEVAGMAVVCDRAVLPPPPQRIAALKNEMVGAYSAQFLGGGSMPGREYTAMSWLIDYLHGRGLL